MDKNCITKEEAIGIAKWLDVGNTGISSMLVLKTFLYGKYIEPKHFAKTSYPHDHADFMRIANLVKLVPSARKSITIIAKESNIEQWKNIDLFWDELILLQKKIYKFDIFFKKLIDME